MKYFTYWSNRHHLLSDKQNFSLSWYLMHKSGCVLCVCDSVIENLLSCLGRQQQKCLCSQCRFSPNDFLAKSFCSVQSHAAAAGALPEVVGIR